MHKLKQIRTRFDQAANAYDAYADLQQEVLQHTFEQAQSYMQEDATILDAGCGIGITLAATVPFLNLVAPIFGVALMVHFFHALNPKYKVLVT